MKKLEKLLLIFTLLFTVNLAYASCKVYYTSYIVNGKTVECECIVCDQITECTCK